MRLTPSDIFRRTYELLTANAAPVVVVFLLLTALGTIVDGALAGEEMVDFLYLLLSLLTLGAQYGLTRVALAAGGQTPAAGFLFGRYFLLSIILTIVVLIGFVLLIVPGVILTIRLAASVPALIAEDLGPREALDSSWRQTKDHFWPLLQLFAAIFVVPGLIYGWASFDAGEGPIPLVPALIANAAFNAALIVGWHASTAVYLLTARRETLAEVFA